MFIEILETDDIIELHSKLINDFGGKPGYYPYTRDKVDWIVNNVDAVVFGEEVYPTIFEKAAMLLYFFSKNHCFVDGNKRIAYNACEIFLAANGYILNTEKLNSYKFVKSIAASNIRETDKRHRYIKKIARALERNSTEFNIG